MRKTVQTFEFFVICLLLTSYAPAQRRLVSMKEYFDDLKQYDSMRRDGPRRIVSTEATINNGDISKSVFTVYENAASGRARSETYTTQGNENTKHEQIWIDSSRYERKDGEPWTKTDTRQLGLGNGSGTGRSRVIGQVQQFSIEATSLDGKPMRLYEILIVENYENELIFRDTRTWIGEDGLQYRREESSGKLSPREETRHLQSTFTYDPTDIKPIEAPIP